MLYGSFYLDVPIKDWFSVNSSLQYISGGLFGILELESKYALNFSIQKTFMNGQLTTYLGFGDVFNTDIMRFNLTLEHLDLYNSKFNDLRHIRLGLVYDIRKSFRDRVQVEDALEEAMSRNAELR